MKREKKEEILFYGMRETVQVKNHFKMIPSPRLKNCFNTVYDITHVEGNAANIFNIFPVRFCVGVKNLGYFILFHFQSTHVDQQRNLQLNYQISKYVFYNLSSSLFVLPASLGCLHARTPSVLSTFSLSWAYRPIWHTQFNQISLEVLDTSP